jgi:hypothetical protein
MNSKNTNLPYLIKNKLNNTLRKKEFYKEGVLWKYHNFKTKYANAYKVYSHKRLR